MQGLRTLLPRIQDEIHAADEAQRHALFARLSFNKHLPISFLVANFHEPWDWQHLSENEGLGSDAVDRFPDWPWDFGGLSFNDNVHTNFYNKHMHRKDWDFCALSCRPNVPLYFVEHHINEDWDFYALSKNRRIDYMFVRDHIDQDWDWRYLISTVDTCMAKLAMRAGIVFDEDDLCLYDLDEIEDDQDAYEAPAKKVREYLRSPYTQLDQVNWHELSRNPHLTESIVLAYRNQEWDWLYLSHHHNMTPRIVQTLSDKPWNFGEYGLSRNENVSESFLEKTMFTKNWNWSTLSHMVSASFVFRYPDKDWNLSFAPLWMPIRPRKKTKAEQTLYDSIEHYPGVGIEFFKAAMDIQGTRGIKR